MSTASTVPVVDYRAGMPGYVLRDWEVVDYACHELAGTGLWFRGPPPPSLAPKTYFTTLGAAQTFGCFCAEPYPQLLAAQLEQPVLNLGYSGAGPRFFLQQPALLERVNAGTFCVLQVMSGRSTSTSVFDNPDGLAHGRWRKDGRPATASDVFKTLLADDMRRLMLPRRWLRRLLNRVPVPLPKVRKIVTEARQNWVADYRALLAQITVPKVLFWFSERPPAYRPRYVNEEGLFGKFPQLVNAEMVAALRPLVEHYVECVSVRGMPQPLVSRFTGEPVAVSLEADQKPLVDGSGETASLYRGTWHVNSYYPSPEMHADGAAALASVARRLRETMRPGVP